MCGIVGKVTFNKKNVNKEEINKMLKSIKHRGPDGDGIYINKTIGFGHTLLKIRDLSDKAKQPFIFKNLCLTFNGEIYNHSELKDILISLGYEFNTKTDTEILIKYLYEFGIDKTLKDIEGCYAFALYNSLTEDVYIVRDRFGIKPLYYYLDDKNILFASEIKAILTEENIKRTIDIDTLLISLNCRLWMDPKKTLFKNINMLLPGTYIHIKKKSVKFIKYYELNFTNEYKTPESVIEDFKVEFEKSIKKKLLSEVPIAAFLSGGLDSSIVCKMLNDNLDDSLNTYTIHYDFDNDLDLNHAKILSEQEKFNNHNILVTADMYNIENIDKVIYSVEEILIDKVYISMYINYMAAKKDGFTVVVSGQGSDEVWLGYINTWGIFKLLGDEVDNNYLINNYYKNNMIFKEKLKDSILCKNEGVMEKYLNRNYVLNTDKMNSYGDLSLKTILHDLLMQEDKIAMANSIESRVPFVDNHKLVEIAYKCSSKIKTYDGREKYIVRNFCKNKIDKSIVEREKYPFPEPPQIYNDVIKKICVENWDEIKKSNLISFIINEEYLKDILNFNDVELWWLLNLWRFEKIFNMEVDYE